MQAGRWKLATVGLGLLVVATVGPVRAEEAPRAAGVAPAPVPAGAGGIDTSSKSSVRDAYLNRLVPAEKVQPNWTGSVKNCIVGTESTKSRNATVQAINYFRVMAGLGPVGRKEKFESAARRAALMMQANGTLDHFPTPGWKCYTADGAKAAKTSNLHVLTGARAVHGYFDDPGAFNGPAGHRRGLLAARLRNVGVGSTSAANTIRTVELSGADGLWGPPLRAPQWVSWPNAGYVPWSVVPTEGDVTELHRWSLSSAAHPGADYSGATVKMTMGGVNLVVTKEAYVTGYGDNTLVWNAKRPSGAPFPMKDSVAIHVVVSGIVGASKATHDYTVRPFPLGPPDAPTAKPPAVVGDDFVTNWAAARANGVPVNGYDVTLTRWDGAKSTVVRRAKVGASARSKRFADLASGKLYCFTVAATSRGGRSPESSGFCANVF